MDIKTLVTITNNFVKELYTAQSGKKTSLPFIVHQLSSHPIVKPGETFQVLKIGGSILQKSLLTRPNGEILIKTFEENHLPVMTTKDIFLSVIDKNISSRASIIAINFAYPLKPVFEDGRLDGILMNGTKEHAFNGLMGSRVGKTIELYIKSKYGRDIKVSTANDTICLTLAGLTRHTAENLSGGIVGTGMNFAVFLDDTHLVNLEAAQFDKFPQTEEGKQVDMQSIERGGALFEKEVSGGYLYHHFNILLNKKQIRHPAIESTHAMDKIARGNISGVSDLARDLFDHSAALISCQIAGITNFKKHDMIFVMEGSLFWVGWRYKQKVEEYVKLLAPKYKITFEEIKDCGIYGAAKLVT
jgi:hexokinase